MKILDLKADRRHVFTTEGLMYTLQKEDMLIIGPESITIIEKDNLTTTIPSIQVRHIISKS